MIGVSLVLEFLIARVRLKVGNINEVINPALDIGYRGLIGSEAPFIIDNKFERMFPPL